ncbi:hypothetical protein [Aequorivita lipolytica]|uniref:DUF4292 domain-containing protein n=2 Tax=Aequorivita lipolytica TaxID=153267 RepID=A0A5C6YT95_9FLAO|nr:hypothetical protein [Aequorivita lipolytica]TXD70616.1 hypothetical protein ESV24_00550 [Aequorivita lipolytica]SRX49649.1 hypothetical protein AEQU2_00112 [Aequorivita lipolytica]
MIRFLAISLLIIAVLTSCSLKTTEGLRQVHFNRMEVENPYFSNANIDYVYKAKIEVYKKNFGGILIIKKIGPANHRVVFTTEFGSKLFDFEFEGETFTKHFIVEDLDKKLIIDILQDDFRVLVNESAKVLSVYESKNQRIYKTESNERFNFYFLEDESEKLEKIVNTTESREKVTIDFTSAEAGIAQTIAIKHNNIKLTIDLEKFKKE